MIDKFNEINRPIHYTVGWVLGSAIVAVGFGLSVTIEVFSYSEISRDLTILVRWLVKWATAGAIVGFIKASWDLVRKSPQVAVKEELNPTEPIVDETAVDSSESSKKEERTAPNVFIEELSPPRGIIFPRLPYKFPTTLFIVAITGFTMRLREFNINDSIVAALGVGGIVWLGIVYFEVFRRYRIRQAIFKQYPKGIIWKNRLFTVKTATGVTAFNHNEIGATDVNESYPTGYGMYRFSDIDVDFVLRIPLGESDIGSGFWSNGKG